jgi:hypothetical protein
MNSFVNLKKRSILLPSGCKDLADFLRLPASAAGDYVHVFIYELFLEAEGAHASEIVIAAPILGDGECFIMQRVNGTFQSVSTIIAAFRAGILERLLRMADIPAATFPARGVATLQLKHRQLKWNLHIESAGGDCRLTPCDE